MNADSLSSSQTANQDYEVVAHTKISYLNVIVVELKSRTPHLHREVEIGLLLRGNLKMRQGNTVYELKQGDSYLINSMEAHEFLSENGALILAIRISPAFFRVSESDVEAIWFQGSHLIRQDLEQQNAYSLFCLICSELALQYVYAPFGTYYRCFTLTTMLVSLLRDCIPYHLMDKKEFAPLMQRSDRLLSVMDYIDKNYTRKLLLEEIAEREGLTLHHLSHIIKDALGISFQEYLKQKRFERARNLVVSTEMSILDISLASGFSDVRYLNALFKDNYDCSPLEYRSRAIQESGREKSPFLNNENYPSREDCAKLLLQVRNRSFSEARQEIAILFGPESSFNAFLTIQDLIQEKPK